MRILALAGGIAGAVALSQFPEFSQQYVQRLSGAVDELRAVTFAFDTAAKVGGLSREEALGAIGAELTAAQARVEALGLSAMLRRSKEGTEAKLFVSDGAVEVKVEVNFVFRGTVLPTERRALTPPATRATSTASRARWRA